MLPIAMLCIRGLHQQLRSNILYILRVYMSVLSTTFIQYRDLFVMFL